MPRVKKAPYVENPAVAAHVAAVGASDPRGAPITLPAGIVPLPLGMPAPPSAPERAVAEPVSGGVRVDAPRALVPCALDDAPVNSKIVVVRADGRKFPLFMTPDGMVELSADDLSHRLPEGARIQRTGPEQFTAIQLEPAVKHPPLVTTTARVAMTQFNKHFHDATD